jgi:DNA-binding transcriptional LysR family regulator
MREIHPAEINPKPLRAFDAVARHRSFSRAATELGRSQTTISLQVRELERQVGARLVDRTTRHIALTETGAQLADSLQAGFRIIDAALQAAVRSADGRCGRFVLACVPSLSASRLPTILSDFADPRARLRIDVEELTSSEIVSALLEGRVDLGIGPSADVLPPEIAFEPAVEEPLYALLAADSEFTGSRGVKFDTLANLPLITLSGSVLLQRTLELTAQRRGIQLTSVGEVRHVSTAIAMARAGVGVAIVPRLALPDSPGVDLFLPIIDPPLSRRVGIIMRRNTRLPTPIARLTRHIRSSLGQAMRRVRRGGAPVVEALECP